MKHLSRRDFIHAGCTVAAASLSPSIVDRAEAYFPHGFVATTTNSSRVSLNVPGTGFMNLAKGANFFQLTAAQINANGYPTSAVSSGTSGFVMVPNYYGQYVWKWSGSGSMQFPALPAIVYSGSAAVASLTQGGGPAGTGYATGNFSVTTAVASPRVVFKFGMLVSSISGGNGSLVTITLPATTQGFGTGSKVSFNQGVASILSGGPNSDGSWTITNTGTGPTTFTLNNSTGLRAITSGDYVGSGGVGTQTEAILQISGCTLSYLNFGTFSNFAALVICQIADETDIGNGLIYKQAFVNQILQLKGTPGGVGRSGDFWLRWMDQSAVQGSFECDFSQRLTANSQCWVATYPISAYQAGTITNGGASGGFTDLYSCASNPTNSPVSGPPIDCEVIQGTPSATNSGGLPGLTVSGRSGFGNWPIIDPTGPLKINVTSAPASTGLSLVFTFSASWLNGGSTYTFTYVTTATGPFGNDTSSIAIFNGNLAAALVADTTLKAGKIVFFNSGGIAFVPPTPLSGVLTVNYTSGPAIVNICTVLGPTSIGTSQTSFIFNALMGGFIHASFVQGLPCEAIVELSNRVGANCWYNWPVYTKGQYITDFTNFMASGTTGLTSGLKFGTEFGNEIWNQFAQPWGHAQAYGIALGCFSYPYGSNEGDYSWQGLRTVQYANLSIAAWAANGRATGQHYILTMTQVDDTNVNGNFDTNCLKGQFLVTSNAIFAAYGGLGCTAQSTSLNASPNRPVDITTATGMAPYWASLWMAGSSDDPGGPNNMAGTAAQNADMLQASFDYASGLTSTAFGLLTNEIIGSTTYPPVIPPQRGYNLGVAYLARFVLQEALCAQYDSYRTGAGLAKLGILHYEAGPQWAVGASFNNGVNTIDSLAATITADTTDVNALVTTMGNLGWTTTQLIPYTISGTGNLTEVATNILQMSQGWKYDTDLNGNPVNTGSYKALIKTYYYSALYSTSGANREVHANQYGYSGGQWGIMYSAWNQATPFYQNFYAISEYNA